MKAAELIVMRSFLYVCVTIQVFFFFVFLRQSQDKIEEERERVNATMLALEEELEGCRDQGEQWKMQLQSATQE